MIIKRLTIIGTGLIGGSFALALRKAGSVEHIIGVDNKPDNLADAKALGIIDESISDLHSAVAA